MSALKSATANEWLSFVFFLLSPESVQSLSLILWFNLNLNHVRIFDVDLLCLPANREVKGRLRYINVKRLKNILKPFKRAQNHVRTPNGSTAALIFTLRFGFLYKAAEINCPKRSQKIIYCKTARKQNKQTNKKTHKAFLLCTNTSSVRS